MQNLEAQMADVADAYVDSPNYIAMLEAAFLRATDIPPECCAVVHQEVDGGDAYYFVRFLGIDENGLHLETVRHRGWLRRNVRRLLEALY